MRISIALGHTVGGHFNPTSAIPPVVAAAAGGLLGAKSSIRARPGKLRLLFAYTTLAAAAFMFASAAIAI